MPGERRIVYILGAGASFGAGAYATKQGGGRVAIPTQNTFWDTFLRFCAHDYNRKTIEKFLYRYFLDYKKVPSRSAESARRRQLVSIDVEEVFTFLSERNYAPSVSPQLKRYTSEVWSALIEEIGHVFGRFRANDQTRQRYRHMRRKHIRTRDTVVSFNYDVVFEQSLPATQSWYYEGIQGTHRPQSLRILKPHGSINWEEIGGAIQSHSPSRGFPRRPVVVAPTHLKFIGTGGRDGGGAKIFGYLNQSERISDVWRAMEREMREAKAWVFIGYSFPSSDLYFSSVLRSTLAARDANPYIAIVNPEGTSISPATRNTFLCPAG
jgi:SIR2-like domain